MLKVYYVVILPLFFSNLTTRGPYVWSGEGHGCRYIYYVETFEIRQTFIHYLFSGFDIPLIWPARSHYFRESDIISE